MRSLLLPQHFSGGVQIRQLSVLSFLLQDMRTTVIWIVLVVVLYIGWHPYPFYSCSLLMVMVNYVFFLQLTAIMD